MPRRPALRMVPPSSIGHCRVSFYRRRLPSVGTIRVVATGWEAIGKTGSIRCGVLRELVSSLRGLEGGGAEMIVVGWEHQHAAKRGFDPLREKQFLAPFCEFAAARGPAI